jgi:thiamine biosynthesis lipoprotein
VTSEPAEQIRPPAARLTQVEHAMGTVFSFVVTTAEGDRLETRAAIGDAVAWLHEVDRRFTTYAPDSEWLRYARGELGLDDVHPDVRHVVDRTRQLTEETEGAFSLTADPHRAPDPAAYVKGWAIQRAAQLVLAGRAQSVFVNGGGDIAITRRSEPWRIGIQDPHDPAGLVATIEIDHGAVATSGAYERGDHVFDPSSGRPAEALASATVVGPDLGTADAYSTALFAAGERGLEWLARRPGYGAYLVRSDGSTVTAGAVRLG